MLGSRSMLVFLTSVCVFYGVPYASSQNVSLSFIEGGKWHSPQDLPIWSLVLLASISALGFIFRGHLWTKNIAKAQGRCTCPSAFVHGEPCGNIHDVSLKTGLTCLCAELPYRKLRGWRFFCQCNCPCPSCDMSDETFCNKIRVCALVFQQRCDPIFYIVLVLLPYVVYACWYYLAPVFERLFTVSLQMVLVWIFTWMFSPILGIILFILGSLVEGAHSVCIHCHDQLPGCAGGETCAFVESQAHNAALSISAGVVAAGSAYKITSMLPRSYLAVITRSVLDTLLSMTRRYLPGTSVSLSGKSIGELLQIARDGSAPCADVLAELGGLIPGTTDADELNVLKLALDFLRIQMEMVKNSTSQPNSSGEVVGLLRYLWAISGKIVVRSTNVATLNVERDASGISGSSRLTERIHWPVSMEQFSDMLFTFSSLCHALGVCNFLLMTVFMREVVFDAILREGYSWQFAAALLVVHLEEIDGSTTLNFSSILNDGSIDRRRRMADNAMVEHYKVHSIFRTGGGKTPVSNGDKKGSPVEWNGRFTKNAKLLCQDYNNGKSECSSDKLYPNGTCKYKHACDAWVTDKGKDGVCGELDCKRAKCQNASRGARQTS